MNPNFEKNHSSLFRSILTARCPRCREGKIFIGSMFNFRKMNKMCETCSECTLRFEKEPGNMAYGGMYMSYVFSTGNFLVVYAILYFFFSDPPLLVYIITIALVALLTFPLNHRYAKVIFLYIIWKM